MDELLPLPHHDAAARRSLREYAALGADAAVRLGRDLSALLHKTDASLAGRKLGPAVFLAASLLCAATFVVTTVYTPSYVVSLEGTPLGTVTSRQDFEGAVERVEARATQILGYDYSLNAQPTYSFALTEKEKISPVSGFETYLFNQIGEVMKTYTLRVGDQFLGAATDKQAIDAMLDELKAPYLNENTVSAEFVDDVSVAYEYTASGVEQDLAKIKEVLHSNSKEKTVYTVVKGDTYSDIAYNNDMAMDDLFALNPQASIDRLMIGDQITVNASVPFLSVETVDAVTYSEELPCPIEEQKSDSMYQGDSKVLDPGVPGEALVSANVTFLNGVEQERTVTQNTVVREATTRVVAVGTKARPKTMPKGYFIWPTYGRITSYFGYRSIFGTYSYHSGLDIAVPYGTTISAADGGTVSWSGYKGSYGKLIIIDHGGGKRTLYGHNSSLLVSTGDKVYQGQAIAKAGSTGRSTGTHCHFEVQLNGTAVNPLSYLS
ncbi:MAG: M23 family metallopeptidase [Oscillospiraceae bacterium]